MKMQGTNRSGEGGEEPATRCDPGSELRRWEREKKGEDNKWDGKRKKMAVMYLVTYVPVLLIVLAV